MARAESIVGTIIAISLALGAIMLLTGSIFLIDYSGSRLDLLSCSSEEETKQICKRVNYYVIAGAVGIVGGVIQLTSSIFVYLDKAEGFVGTLFLVALASVTSFSLGMSQDVLNREIIPGPHGDRAINFMVSVGLNMVFTPIAALVTIYFLRRKSSETAINLSEASSI